MKYFIISILLFVALLNAIGQKATDANVVGDVKDKKTGEHIPFINVHLVNTLIGTSTDHTGHYFLKNLPEGTYSIRVSGIGYKTVEQEVQIMAGKTIEINFVTEESTLALDEVVVSANRNETNRKDASVVVGVLSPKTFAATNAVCMADGLSFQPGVRVENDCNNCGYSQVRINGLDGQYSQLLIDSRPVFSALAGVYGLEQIPVNMIERVEVIRGGGSALYGASAIAGTINIITKEALNNSFSIGYNYQQTGASPDHTLNLNTSLVTDDNKGGINFYGTYRNRSPYDYNDDGFSELPRLLSRVMGLRAYHRLGANSKLTIEYHTINEFRRGGNAFDLPAHEADIAEQIGHEINSGNIGFTWFDAGGKQKVNAFVSAQHIHRNSYYGVDKDLKAYGNTTNTTAIGGLQYIRNFGKLWFLPAELTSGIEYQTDRITDRMPGYKRNFSQHTGIGGFFVQNEWKNKKLNILLGGRVDKHNLLKRAVLSPRISFKYNLTAQLGWRIAYAAGYRAPQAFDEDLHISAVGGEIRLIALDDKLRPEYSHSLTTSLDYYFRIGNSDANLLLEGFNTRINDIFVLSENGVSPDGYLLMLRRNGKGAVVSGLNAEGRIVPSKLVQLQFGFTLQKSLYDEAEQWSDDPAALAERRMLRTPTDYGYFTLSYSPAKNLVFNTTGTYTGSMLAPHYQGYISSDRLETTTAFLDLNLKLSYELRLNGTAMQLYGGVKNLFNSYQRDLDKGMLRHAGYVYGPSLPRSFFVGLKFTN